MKKGGGSGSTIIVGPSNSVLVYALLSLKYVLGLARFQVFVPKLYYYIILSSKTPKYFMDETDDIFNIKLQVICNTTIYNGIGSWEIFVPFPNPGSPFTKAPPTGPLPYCHP